MIELQNVTKVYGTDVVALDKLSFTVAKGEFVFLTGPSGAGKSTLLRLLLRQELPTDGQLTVAGRSLTGLTTREVQDYRRSLGVVFQDFKLIPTKTVFDNVTFVMRVLGVPVEQQRRRTYQVLKWVGLQHRALAYPPELSGGEQQRIAIARALVNDPQLVLADEPTGNLDPDLSLEIMDLFREINAGGTTVLVATHDRALIAHVGRRVLHLEQGRVPAGDGVRALVYAWSEARLSLQRGRWALLLSVATIAVALTMLGAFRVVSDNLARVADGWRSAAEMTVYLDDVVTEAERTAARQLIERSPAVEHVTFVTKEEALARFGADFPELGDITASLDTNPFPASFDVRLRTDDAAAEGAQALAAALARQAGVVDVRYDQRWIDRLLAVLAALRTAGWASALALVLGAATTVVAVVRLSFEARREEIAIMGLVGAPVSFIRGPFVMEGAIQGGLGAIAALGALASLGRVVGRALGPAVTALGPDALRPLSGWDAAGLVLLGAAVGALAGLLATWRWDPDQGSAAR